MSTYDVVLTEYPDGQWTIEPVGIEGVAAREHVVSGDLHSLIDGDARLLLAHLTGADVFDFDLRFVSSAGELLATSVITATPPGRHHRPGARHEHVEFFGRLSQEFAATA